MRSKTLVSSELPPWMLTGFESYIPGILSGRLTLRLAAPAGAKPHIRIFQYPSRALCGKRISSNAGNQRNEFLLRAAEIACEPCLVVLQKMLRKIVTIAELKKRNVMQRKTYDPKCLELAEVFLQDVPPEAKKPNSADELAMLIQDTIEMYIGVELGVMPND